MNTFLAYLQHYYGLLAIPLIGMVIAQVIIFFARRFLDSLPDELPAGSQETTEQSQQVIQLENELKRLRAELDFVETRLTGYANPSRMRSLSSTAPMGAYVGGLRHRRARLAIG